MLNFKRLLSVQLLVLARRLHALVILIVFQPTHSKKFVILIREDATNATIMTIVTLATTVMSIFVITHVQSMTIASSAMIIPNVSPMSANPAKKIATVPISSITAEALNA